MLQAAFKLFFLSASVLGPFGAGLLWHVVAVPEVYAFFLLAGVLAGFGGAIGFAWIEAGEAERHLRALRGPAREG